MFLKNKNIIFKIRRSKVTDYAALKHRFLRIELKFHMTTPYDWLAKIYANLIILTYYFCSGHMTKMAAILW